MSFLHFTKYITKGNHMAPQQADFQTTNIQQDDATLHWVLHVREFLNETFPNRCIGRDVPILCPSHSLDITPLEFFLLGYVNDIVYRIEYIYLSGFPSK